jgi:hypothetical protein
VTIHAPRGGNHELLLYFVAETNVYYRFRVEREFLGYLPNLLDRAPVLPLKFADCIEKIQFSVKTALNFMDTSTWIY